MTIKYTILVKDATREERMRLTEEYCCYGNVNRHLVRSQMTRTGYKSERMFTYGRFQGIHLDLKWDSPYGQGTTRKQRQEYWRMFCELGFPKWLGGFADDSLTGDWFETTVDKFNTINSITFNKHCPMYLAVAATGVWRLFANAPHLLYMYRNLMNECLRPHVALCGALNVAQQGSERGFYPSTQSYQIAHYSTHMPWSWQCLDVRGIAHLQQLTHDDFKKLESMYDEQKRTKGLTYVGRDLFFLGWKPGDGLYGRDIGLEYLTQREWENRFCTGGVLESRYSSRTMTSEELLTWLNGLQQDAKALKGKDLHLPKRQIDKIIKDAQSKKERTAKFKAKLLKQTTGATHESNSRT